jgi:hypothetical protein
MNAVMEDWRGTPIHVGSRIVYSGLGVTVLEAEVTNLGRWPHKVTALAVDSSPKREIESRKRWGVQPSTIPGVRVTVVA